MKLFIGGGFKDATRSVMLSNGSVSSVPELQSNQKEADTRLLLHTAYAAREGSERVILCANDTNVVVLSISYYKTLLQDLGLKELWMKLKQTPTYQYMRQPVNLTRSCVVHFRSYTVLSGRDTTSYPYFTGKKVWLRKSKTVPLDDLANFAEDGDFNLSYDIVNQARQLVITRLLS